MSFNQIVIVLLVLKVVFHILLLRKHKIKQNLVTAFVEVVLPVPYFNSIPKTDEAKYSRILLSFFSFLILGFMVLTTLVRFGILHA